MDVLIFCCFQAASIQSRHHPGRCFRRILYPVSSADHKITYPIPVSTDLLSAYSLTCSMVSRPAGAHWIVLSSHRIHGTHAIPLYVPYVPAAICSPSLLSCKIDQQSQAGQVPQHVPQRQAAGTQDQRCTLLPFLLPVPGKCTVVFIHRLVLSTALRRFPSFAYTLK